MKILMLGWELPPITTGGLGTACFNLCHALSKQGIDIDFIVPFKTKYPAADFMRVLSATPISLDSASSSGSPYSSPYYPYSPYFEFYSIKKYPINSPYSPYSPYSSYSVYSAYSPYSYQNPLREIQEKYRDFILSLCKKSQESGKTYDCIHAHDWLTLEAGLAAKQKYHIPLVVQIHSTEYDRSGGAPKNPEIQNIEKTLLPLADKIIAVSSYTKDILVEKYHIESEKITIIPNSLDESFEPNSRDER